MNYGSFYYIGTTALIYHVNIYHTSLDIKEGETEETWKARKGITEFGIKYRNTEGDDVYVALPHPMSLPTSGKPFVETETENVIYSVPNFKYLWGVPKCPIRVVIKNPHRSSVEVGTYRIDNDGTRRIGDMLENTHTMSVTDQYEAVNYVRYYCSNITGGSETNREKLRASMDMACEIFNSMTAFRKEYATNPEDLTFVDHLNTSEGGTFSAEIVSELDGGASSNMKFGNLAAYCDLATVVHEMAHNLMYPTQDFEEGTEAYNKMATFMQFATGAPHAIWRWLGRHNYPVITPYTVATRKDVYCVNGTEQVPKVDAYYVAAACYVCREAAGLV